MPIRAQHEAYQEVVALCELDLEPTLISLVMGPTSSKIAVISVNFPHKIFYGGDTLSGEITLNQALLDLFGFQEIHARLKQDITL